MTSPSLGHYPVPPRDHTDQWLFLAQHVGIPTRLLDWTEGSLVALYFALKEEQPVVWMLNPLGLNWLSTNEKVDHSDFDTYGLTWIDRESGVNLAFENIKAAWSGDTGGTILPAAVHPTYIHPRLTVQRSCFTVHGREKDGLAELLKDKNLLRIYSIDPGSRIQIAEDLRILGVTQSTLFPDLDGLATDITRLWRPDLTDTYD
jgi:hypothetical protein